VEGARRRGHQRLRHGPQVARRHISKAPPSNSWARITSGEDAESRLVPPRTMIQRGRSRVVRRQLPKLKTTGSIPVARSTSRWPGGCFSGPLLCLRGSKRCTAPSVPVARLELAQHVERPRAQPEGLTASTYTVSNSRSSLSRAGSNARRPTSRKPARSSMRAIVSRS
jgi:hypothetical protein